MNRQHHSNHPSRQDEDFANMVLRQIENSGKNMDKINNTLWSGFREKKLLVLEDHDFIQNPNSYPDSKIIVYYFFNGVPFEDQEVDEDELKLKELWAFLKLENYFETPHIATSNPNFNWHQYIELFLNWRGH